MCNEYKSRYGDNPSQGNIKIAEDSKGFKVDETNTPTSDAHAIIYHVTKSFLETTKMNIGSGKAITTACLNAVDACVFGNCYANVYVDLKEMVKEEVRAEERELVGGESSLLVFIHFALS